MGRQITVFSLDTSIIQSAGYRLDSGALKVLREQIPDWMRLVMPEVVVREVVDHRMQAVRAAHQEAENALGQLERSLGTSLERLRTQLTQYRLIERSPAAFTKEIAAYAARFRGEILELKSLSIITEMFDRYFNLEPPFGGTKKSKSEFPDAASLIALEQYAEEKRTNAVLVSGDGGWQSFAAQSPNLYCVSSLEDFAALYASPSERAKAAVAGATKAIASPKSKIHQKVLAEVSALFARGPWVVKATDAELKPLRGRTTGISIASITGKARRSWVAAHDQNLFVIETFLTVAAEISVEVSIPNSAGLLEARQRVVSREFGVSAYLTVSAQKGQSENWDAELQIAETSLAVDAGEFPS